ncbi:MAG: hypothetical protein FWH38_05195 [Treponema sp.]|nr:hypothetical protein [Treponema sp.]
MKKFLFSAALLFAAMAVYAQNTGGQVQQMDASVKNIADELNKKLAEVKAAKIALGQFIYGESIPSLGDYWANQLAEELTNTPDRSYAVLSRESPGAEWTISGEIVEVVDVIRVYIRLVRSESRTNEAAFHSDYERNVSLIQMLSGDNSRVGGSPSPVPRDAYESDSWDNPVPFETGADENNPVMNRTLHNGNDEDFFLLIPAGDGRLLMETAGSIDTYMELYDAETAELLDEDDDSGSSYNARIRYNVQAGHRYIAKVRGYDSGDTGHYSFRAYLQN